MLAPTGPLKHQTVESRLVLGSVISVQYLMRELHLNQNLIPILDQMDPVSISHFSIIVNTFSYYFKLWWYCRSTFSGIKAKGLCWRCLLACPTLVHIWDTASRIYSTCLACECVCVCCVCVVYVFLPQSLNCLVWVRLKLVWKRKEEVGYSRVLKKSPWWGSRWNYHKQAQAQTSWPWTDFYFDFGRIWQEWWTVVIKVLQDK